ncbi:hypothetical protein A3C89_01420 [Candidatus Kaiserbacteria bacterium RIFCSPHIGHO2_02_FULL_50_50]|uniref:Large ribosomal subunit protein bL25 n=1 Tax=Candidatus Kaiserbacteria bacterium RIFCSPHIGHO2_02_FULL_50_50 TaxID=1798492 RepID=A0A1F6DCI7_9BACT|nr:MAG: hypothetical protein A3C89_01420 [Candidatus Kaiserbacteria bacterium RIFCSPHIGHO2_02_FULL_50_50]OGG89302.1 MAG: hypothetical protein A3G62_01495 [Candidatus Kaiserbacteria bacterium RIFCSPLOWO2_12_FULL_50_10]
MKSVKNTIYFISVFSMTITLEALPRVVKSNEARRLRRAGRVPAIVYGRTQSPTTISVEGAAFSKVLKEAGESTVVELSVNGTKMPTLVHALAHSALDNSFEHIDFLVVDATQKVQVDVPIIFVGEAPAEKLGVITKVLHEIHVEALPADLPHDITVDLSSLIDLTSNIRVKDLVAPQGVVFLHDPEQVVVAVTAQAEEEETPVAESQPEPELATNKKKETSETPA